MSIRSKWNYIDDYYFDDVTFERVLPIRGITFYEEFLGAGWTQPIPTAPTFGTPWIKKGVRTAGAPTVGALANVGGGVLQLAIDNTSEKQEASFYHGDQRTLDPTKALNIAARVQFPVIPSGAMAVFGLHTAWIDGPDNAASYAHFMLNGNGTILCESFDGTTAMSVSSGLTVATTTEWHDLLIDFNRLSTAGISFRIDGNSVASTSVFPFAATGTAALLQPYFSAYKAAGAGVASMNVDYVRSWANRL